jgi:hypothetical protein
VTSVLERKYFDGLIVCDNGNIICSTEASLHFKTTEILRVVADIQNHSKPVTEHCYREFLLQNHDPDEREYPDPRCADSRYSQKDIEICLGFDVEPIAATTKYMQVRELHEVLRAKYGEDVASGAA